MLIWTIWELILLEIVASVETLVMKAGILVLIIMMRMTGIISALFANVFRIDAFLVSEESHVKSSNVSCFIFNIYRKDLSFYAIFQWFYRFMVILNIFSLYSATS